MSIAFDPTLYHGRPADEAGRLPRETAVYDLLERLAADPALPLSREDMDTLLKPAAYVGLAPEQTERFVKDILLPALGSDGCPESGQVTL